MRVRRIVRILGISNWLLTLFSRKVDEKNRLDIGEIRSIAVHAGDPGNIIISMVQAHVKCYMETAVYWTSGIFLYRYRHLELGMC